MRSRLYQLSLSFLATLSIVLLLSSCQHKHTANTGFYYWRTEYALSDNENAFFNQAGASKLYLRFFEVKNWNYDSPDFPYSPSATVKFEQDIPATIEVVPVVYIPNETLLKTDTSKIPELAAKMRRKLQRMCSRHVAGKVREYQLDCDWTSTTQAAFFKLVREFKAQVQPAEVSVTVRLHQYKYAAKTGVPPANRALLMFYNMGKLEDYNEENYILNLKEAAKYLGGSKYALPLDIGLPLYSQGVIFHDNRFYNLAQASEIEEAIGKNWIRNSTGNRYVTTGDSTAPWAFMGKDISVRYEKVDMAMLHEAAEMLRSAVRNDSCNIVFYHLDQVQLNSFKPYDIQKLVEDF